MRRTIVTIPLNGPVSFEHEGFHGVGCKEASDRIIKALGGKVIDREDKPEMYENPNTESQKETI
jgi:hypothetical protein